ncbi:RNA polymerase sigma factor (sigma-70 family) [Pedobacter sp. CG_S7]|uniref:sigma factor n=1 Tax=Pedobacter sp. CG_S7 TaxID=3143930 RepID=UPI003396B8FE
MDSRNNVESTGEIIETWVKLYINSLYRWALIKTSEKEKAEDLVQDTFLAAYQQLENFNGKSSPKTWLLAILNNKIKG